MRTSQAKRGSRNRRKTLLLTVGVAGFLFWSYGSRDRRLKQEARPVITAAEAWRAAHGHYPESIPITSPPGLPDGELFYKRESDGSFIIWYGLSLGESNTYRSVTGAWTY